MTGRGCAATVEFGKQLGSGRLFRVLGPLRSRDLALNAALPLVDSLEHRCVADVDLLSDLPDDPLEPEENVVRWVRRSAGVVDQELERELARAPAEDLPSWS